MATAREEGGFGAGGKFRKRPFKRATQTTPYDRPSTALRNHHPPNINVNNNNGWLSKLVDPAQKLIISSAHRLFASVFRKRLPPPPTLEPEANREAKEVNQEIVSSTVCPGVQGATNGHDEPHGTSDREHTELEQILKQKTFTRSEIDRLTALLHSRTADMPVGNDDQKRPKVIPSTSLVSHDRKEASLSTPIKENGSGNQLISKPVALDEDVASPVELAKAYMSSVPSKVSPSMLGLRSQMCREESTLMSDGPFSAASPSMSLVPRFSGQVGVSENGFVTPRSRGRSAIYNMARTPYSRLSSTATLKSTRPSVDVLSGPSSLSHSTLEKNSLTGSKHGTQKRRSSVLDADIGSVGPIRRIRQKPNLLTSKTSSLAASGSLLSMHGARVSDAVQQPSSSMQKPLLLGDNKVSSIPTTSFTPVPSKSSEVASKILQQLDKLVSPREKSPMKLSPSMLHGPALKSLENVDSSMLLENVQESNELDVSGHTSLPDARDSTSQKLDKVEENGPTKFISSFDKLVPAMNGAEAAGNNNNDVAGIKTADSALMKSTAYSYPQKKRGFQMSAHEDYLELDDDDHFNGAVSTTLAEDREKLGAGAENKAAAAEAARAEKPSAHSDVNSPSSLLSKTSNLGTTGGSMFAEKSSVFSFMAAPFPSVTPQPAPVATASSLISNNAANASPIFNFGGKVASPKESNDVSSTFNTRATNVDKIPQFTGVPSSSVSELPAVKFGASFDPKPGTSNSPASVTVGVIDSIVPESDKVDKQPNPNDGIIFRIPETVPPTAASTSASAPSIFAFGAPANSSSLNNGSLASSSSVTSSSMSPLASSTAVTSSSMSPLASSPSVTSSSTSTLTSNTFTSQNLFNSSTTALSTINSIAASTTTTTTTTSVTTPFTAAPIFKFGSSAVLSTSVSPVSATFGIESAEPKTKDANFGNSAGTPIGGTSAFTSTQSSIFSGTSSAITGTGSSIFGGTSPAITGTGSSIFGGTSPAITGTGSSIFGGTSPAITGTGSSIFGGTSPAITGTGSSIFGGTSAVTSTVSSMSVGVSPPVTSAGGIFGITSASTGTGSCIFGFSAGASSAATSQSLFSNPFTAGSAQASGTGNGVVTSSQTVPVQFGSSATLPSFGSVGNPGFSSSSSPFGSSVSAAKPFSSSPSFGLNSVTSLSEANSISSGSGAAPSIFGSNWQAPKSPTVFGSTFSSSTPATFNFSATTSTAATNSAPVFGSSTVASSSSISPFTATAAATSSQPAFGPAGSVNPFGSALSNNNDQISMEDSMAEDTTQASTLTVPAFGQQSITPSAGFVFGSAAPPSAFPFSGQQNLVSPQNSSIFQASNSLEFNGAAAGGSFSLGTGGGDKSKRRIVKINKGKQRRK